MEKNMKVSFVIPCYCSEKSITGVVGEIDEAVRLHGYEYEIILVNDCSPDRTWDVIQEICRSNPYTKGISLTYNFGQHAAIIAGLRYVKGDVVCCLDDDGQTPPKEAFKLINETKKHDIVMAKYDRIRQNIIRRVGSKINDYMAVYMIGKPKDLQATSFFACRRFVAEEMIKYDNPYPYILGLLLRTTKDIVNVPIEHKERTSGASGYTFGKLVSLWLNGFTSFSMKPLRIATTIGFASALSGFIFAIYIVVKRLLVPETPAGYSSIMAAFMLIGGMIMLMLGLIGEYIGRIYISINNAPQYIIRDTVNVEGTDENHV